MVPWRCWFAQPEVATRTSGHGVRPWQDASGVARNSFARYRFWKDGWKVGSWKTFSISKMEFFRYNFF